MDAVIHSCRSGKKSRPLTQGEQDDIDAYHAQCQAASYPPCIFSYSGHLHEDYCAIIHTHSQGDVLGLDATISALGDSISGKADVSHTHAYEPANANIQGHIASAHAPSNAQANADITKAEIEARLTGVISSHSHSGGSTVGYVLNPFAGNAATLTDGQTIYFGGTPAVAPSTTGGNHRLYVPKAGAIKAAYIYAHSATAGTGESWPLYIRLNNTTDTLIQALLVANAQRVWVNTSLNITVAQGDYIEIKSVNPTWATNPANVRFGGSIYIE